MKQNMSGADRIIRLIIVIIFAVLYFTGTAEGTLGLILLIAAIIFLFTSMTGFCPIYRIFGLSTRKETPSSN